MKHLIASMLAALAVAPVEAEPGAAVSLAIRATDPALIWGPCPALFAGNCDIAVLRGDPSKPGADIFLRVRPGRSLVPHRHSSAERMILVSGRLTVRYKGSAPVTLVPGQYAYGPPIMPHSASCIGRQPCTLFIAFDDPVDALPHPGGLD